MRSSVTRSGDRSPDTPAIRGAGRRAAAAGPYARQTHGGARTGGPLPSWDVILLLLRGGPQDRTGQLLPVLAFAAVTALALTVTGGAEFFMSVEDPGQQYPVRGLYLGLTAIAVAILAVPLATLGASAVRLSTRRQDTRLASLRLLGAPTSLLRTLTVVEAGMLAGIGASLGVPLHLLLAPVVGQLHFVGQRLGMGAVVPSWWLGGLTVLAVVGLAVLTATFGLRRITITPLGVRTRQDAPGVRWLMLVAGAVLLAVAVMAMGSMSGMGDEATSIVVMLGALSVGMAVLNLLGPPVLGLVSRIRLRRVRGRRSAVRLLALRALLDDPRAAWQQASGVAMISFVAVVVGAGLAMAGLAGEGSMNAVDAMIVQDMRTGVLVTVALAFATVSAALTVHAAAQVFDRRALHVSLERLGMPRATIDEARVRTALQPLVTVCLLGITSGALVVLPLTGAALLMDPVTLVTVGASPVVGLLVARFAVAGTRPLLTQVLDSAEPVV